MRENKEYYENLINSKKYWDIRSDEFGSIDTDEKLLNIAEYLNLGGNLHYLISRYKRTKSIEIRDVVRETIGYFLEKLADDDNLSFDGFSESQLITILSRELQNRLFEDYNGNNNEPKPKISYGNFKPNLEFKEDKETLFYDNPWLDLVDEITDNSYMPLKENIHLEDK